MKKVLAETKSDTTHIATLNRMARALMFSAPDTSLIYAQEALQKAQQNNFPKGAAQALTILSKTYSY